MDDVSIVTEKVEEIEGVMGKRKIFDEALWQNANVDAEAGAALPRPLGPAPSVCPPLQSAAAPADPAGSANNG